MKKPEIYVSTGAFKEKDIEQILEIAMQNNIKNIELSSGLIYKQNIKIILNKYKNSFNFLIHNYFPPQKEPFMLNLASSNEIIISKSLTLCKESIELSAQLGSEFYSIHCGFTFDSNGSHLGNESQLTLRRIPMSDAFDNFVRNIIYLNNFAKSVGIKLAIENNVLAAYGLIQGKNDLCLGATLEDLQSIFNRVNDDNLHLLLDLGHAKVNTKTLGVNINNLVKDFYDRIIGVHVSDNNGESDSNNKISADSELLDHIKNLKEKYMILEVYDLELDEIKEQISTLKENIS